MIMRMLSRLMTMAFSRTRTAVGYGVLTCALTCRSYFPKVHAHTPDPLTPVACQSSLPASDI